MRLWNAFVLKTGLFVHFIFSTCHFPLLLCHQNTHMKIHTNQRIEIFGIALLMILPFLSFSQDKFTISGKITDAENGEDLIGATIFDIEQQLGTSTNTYGFFSLTLPEGNYKLQISYLGFQTITKKIQLDENLKLNISLEPSSNSLDEVEIISEKKDANLSSAQMSVEKMDMKQISKLPVLFGEKDILKTIQLLPGISATSEGGNGFSVRGGSIDQNLILLDEAPVYSASHLMGFFSVFNSDALKNMSVYKGGIPANYGGRASSVLDISMKDGNNQNFQVSGGLGLISSRLTLEGPIIKDKMSFIVSGRRSYADLVAGAVGILDDDANLYFYDLNAKLNYQINDNNRIFLSGYFGNDEFGYGAMGMNWGNKTGTLRWNHIFNSKLFSNTTLIYSEYDYGFKLNDGESELSSGIVDYGFKQDFTYFLNPKNTLSFGFNSTHHTFNPGKLEHENNDNTEILLDEKFALESSIYLSNKQEITDRVSAEYGLRISNFSQLGEGYNNTYNEDNQIVDSVYFGKNEVMQSYNSIEPRLSLSYRLAEDKSIKASYNKMGQYLHLMSNSTSGQPTDTWVPSSHNIQPLDVNQYALGYFQNFQDNNYEFSVEAYYKDMYNITDFKDGADIVLNENLESYILQGKGRSFGAEFYLKKKTGKFTGWLSYTLSRTENQIEGINNNEWYPSKIDKTHDISLVGSYQINKRWSVSATWVYYTGNAVTFPSGKYEYDGFTYPYYTERNGYRMPDYHRLDLNVHLEGKQKKRFKSSWDFSIYNAYNRYNAYSIDFQESETVPGTTEAVQLSLFGIVPSVTWNFKF